LIVEERLSEDGDEGGIGDAAKGGKMAAGDKAQKRAEAFLVRHGEEERAAGTEKAGEFAEEEAGILQMRDDFHADDEIERAIGQRKRIVEVGLEPADVFGEIAGAGEEVGAGDGSGPGELEELLNEEAPARAEFEEVAAELQALKEGKSETIDGLRADAAGIFGGVKALFTKGAHPRSMR